MEIVYPREWENILDELLANMGVALIIGETDSGKSTLTRYLVGTLVRQEIAVSLLDSDIGQSSLGLPGTVSIRIFRNKKDFTEFRYEKMFFIGDISPAKKIDAIIDAAREAVGICRKESRITIVDTTGLVSGKAGEILKTRKTEAIKPDFLIALQRVDELEHILSLLPETNVRRTPVSPFAEVRSRAFRIRYRRRKLEEYFGAERLRDFILRKNEAAFFFREERITPAEGYFAEGTIIGLNNAKETMALGILTGIGDKSVTFSAPLETLSGINKAIFGEMTIP